MTTTTYLELEDQATGANDGTWGDVADSNFQLLELAIARRLALSTTGGTSTLSSSQNRYPIIVVSGSLASNAVIEVKTWEKNWIFLNNTTGAYTVQVKTAAGTGIIIPRRRATKLYCDGTNVVVAREPSIPQVTAAGSADAMTGNIYPEITSADLTDDLLVIVECYGANTVTNPTFNPNGIGNKTIYRYGGAALKVGDIPAARYRALLSYSVTDGGFTLLNPAIDDLLLAEGSNITDGATITVPATGGYFKLITSTTAITDFSITNAFAGRRFVVEFDTARTLTYNGTSLILPSAADITTAQGDKAEFECTGSGSNVRCLWYTRANGKGVTQGWEQLGIVTASASSSVNITGLSNFRAVRVTFHGVNLSASAVLRMQLYDGSSYITSGYAGNVQTASAGGAFSGAAPNAAGSFMSNNTPVEGGGDMSGQITVTGLNTTAKKVFVGQMQYTTSSPAEAAVLLAMYNANASAMSGLRFIPDSGNIASGTFVFEGLR